MPYERNDYHGYSLNRTETWGLWAALAGASLFLAVIFFDHPLPAAAGILLYQGAKREVEKHLAERRRKQLRNQFRDFLYAVSASFSLGRHMTESMEEALVELRKLYPESAPIVQETSRMTGLIRGGAAGEVEVLQDFSRRAGLAEVDDMVRVFMACRETGGNLSMAMNRAAELIGEEMEIEDEIRMQVVQRKAEGRIITVMPVLIILFLRTVSPDYIGVLYQTWAGRIIMSAALAVTIGTYLVIERITNVEV